MNFKKKKNNNERNNNQQNHLWSSQRSFFFIVVKISSKLSHSLSLYAYEVISSQNMMMTQTKKMDEYIEEEEE